MQYPVSLAPRWYNGNDPKKLKKYEKQWDHAKMIEEYINRKIASDWPDDRQAILMYSEIAYDLGIKAQDVYNILFFAAGGSNGVTVYNPNGKELEYED